jgi:uncharacterized protein (TIGR02231 family)
MRSLAWVYVLLHGAAASAAATTVSTSPRAVTVFPSGALVERQGEVSLAQGLHRITVLGLPARMEDASVRIRLRGEATPHLVGFAVEQVPIAEVVSPAAREIEKELTALGDEDKALADAQSVLADRRSFILSLRATFEKKATLNMALAPIDSAGWAAVFGFTRDKLGELGKEALKLSQERRELGKKIELARRKLDKLSSQREKQTKSLAVDLRTGGRGNVQVELRYLIPGASWRSLYDAYLDGEGTKVRFVHYGIVTQQTGEDWDGVKLTLSSADSSQRVAVPVLTPQTLAFYTPQQPRYTRGSYRRYEPAAKPKPAPSRPMGGAAPDQAPPAPPPPPKDEEQAIGVGRTAEFAATYEIEGEVSVPSTGTPRKITVAIVPVAAELEYLSAPRVSPGAFLLARGQYKREIPLLPGTVNLFLGSDYVGETHIGFVPFGGELRLPFGRDDRVRVRRVQLERKVNSQGVFTKEYRIDYAWRVNIENLTGRRMTLSLLDRVPSSMDERIKVEIHERTPPRAPLKPDDPKGTLRFELPLAPGEKREIYIGFSVSYPRELSVSGLE